MEQFEDVRFAGAGWRVDDDVFAGAQRMHRFLLPEIGQKKALAE